MNFFSKVFGASSTTQEVYEPQRSEIAPVAESPFVSFVKDAIIRGASALEPVGVDPALADHAEYEFYEEDEEEEEEEDDDYPVYTVYDESDDLAAYDEESDEELDEDLDEAQPAPVLEETTSIIESKRPVPTELGAPLRGSDVFHASSLTQSNDSQVERIVDGLFDRMRVVWGDDGAKRPVAESKEPTNSVVKVPSKTKPQQGQDYPLAQSKADLAQLIRKEVPQALKGEFVTVMRTEVMTAVRGEIARVLREDLEVFNRSISKGLEQLSQIETRIARIEGAIDREVKINFPKGAVQINAPITIPEREVKIAAPINVQPPSVVFDEGAIAVHFTKGTQQAKTVKFERDPHSQDIKSATIVAEPSSD